MGNKVQVKTSALAALTLHEVDDSSSFIHPIASLLQKNHIYHSDGGILCTQEHQEKRDGAGLFLLTEISFYKAAREPGYI